MTLQVPRQSIVYMVLAIAIVLIFIFAGILPMQKTLIGLDKQVADSQNQIEEHKVLSPIYKALEQSLLQAQSLQTRTMPSEVRLARSEISTIPVKMKSLASSVGMNLTSVIPETGSMTNDSNIMPLRIVLKGEFFNFRKFLIALGGIPYVLSIDEMSIRQADPNQEYTVKMYIGLK